MTLLTVDDNQKIRSLIGVILKDSGFTILEADSGETAIKLFMDNCPEVVLMDIKMDGIDGLTATKVIRELSEKVKIIIVTDYNEDSLRERAMTAGANDYLLKENLLALKEMLKN